MTRLVEVKSFGIKYRFPPSSYRTHLSREDVTMTAPTPVSHKQRTVRLPEREKLVQEFAKRYRSGESIRVIAESAGRPYGTVHRWLAGAGVQMRPRGGSRQKSVPPSVVAGVGGC